MYAIILSNVCSYVYKEIQLFVDVSLCLFLFYLFTYLIHALYPFFYLLLVIRIYSFGLLSLLFDHTYNLGPILCVGTWFIQIFQVFPSAIYYSYLELIGNIQVKSCVKITCKIISIIKIKKFYPLLFPHWYLTNFFVFKN